AYTRGKAASNPAPARISQVSLPSHTGATEFIITSRASSSGAKGNRMPTPRSKPSISTYIMMLKAMITAQIMLRSMPCMALPSLFDADVAGRQRPFGPLDVMRLIRLVDALDARTQHPHQIVD